MALPRRWVARRISLRAFAAGQSCRHRRPFLRMGRRATALEDRSVAAPCVEGAVAGHGADLVIRWDLVEQARQNGAIALVAGGELHRPDVTGDSVHRQLDLAILASAVGAVLPRQPFPVAEEFDPCAVHQQVRWPRCTAGCTAARYLHFDGPLPAAQGRKIWNRPVEPGHRQDARHHPGCLPKRKPEQDLHHQAELDRGIREHRRSTITTSPGPQPHHGLVPPDQQRPVETTQ